MRLTPEHAGEMYRAGKSACVIAAEFKIRPSRAADRIRAAGLGGNVWCPIHRTHETIRNLPRSLR